MTQTWLSLIQRVSATYIAVRPFKSTKQRKRGGPALYARWEFQSSLQDIAGANPVPGTFNLFRPTYQWFIYVRGACNCVTWG